MPIRTRCCRASRFKPFALIDGTVALGYRNFETLSPLVPDFGGFVAQVDLGYTLRATRFGGTYDRDVTYSFQNTEPYYLQTDWELNVMQKITTTWDVVGRFGHYRLDYEIVGIPGERQRTDSGRRLWWRRRLHARPVRPVGIRRGLHGSSLGS